MITRNTRKDNRASPMPAILALIFMAQFSFVIYRLSSPEPIASGSENIFYFICGQLTTLLGVSIGYWYNSNYGSKAKDQLIANSVPIKRSENDLE